MNYRLLFLVLVFGIILSACSWKKEIIDIRDIDPDNHVGKTVVVEGWITRKISSRKLTKPYELKDQYGQTIVIQYKWGYPDLNKKYRIRGIVMLDLDMDIYLQELDRKKIAPLRRIFVFLIFILFLFYIIRILLRPARDPQEVEEENGETYYEPEESEFYSEIIHEGDTYAVHDYYLDTALYGGYLKILDGKDQGETIPIHLIRLDTPSTSIGTAEHNPGKDFHIEMKDHSMASFQAEFQGHRSRKYHVSIRNTSSFKPTLVNGWEVDDNKFQVLFKGDIITCGERNFKYEL